ncbi:TPA: DUF6537 domain-containing protein [Legionella pneumophila]
MARLYTDGAFLQRLREQFDGDFTLRFHLAPPLLARRNDKGELVKREYGPWVMGAFRVLARLKGLRGTAFDPFGHTEERRTERALIREYEAAVEEVLRDLRADRLPLALEIARWPARVKGFGHVKERNLRAARPLWDDLLRRWRAGRAVTAPTQRAAAGGLGMFCLEMFNKGIIIFDLLNKATIFFCFESSFCISLVLKFFGSFFNKVKL